MSLGLDPVSLGLGVVGLGMSIFGGLGAAKTAGAEASVSEAEATQELNINNAKQQAMEINGRRTQLQNVRNNQLARAQATNAATQQGAQFGSGFQGGLAQVTDNSLFNMQGVNDALQTGRTINVANQRISEDKYQMAALGGTMATDQGIASLGGAFMKAGPTVGALSKGFGSNNWGQSLFGGGSPSGYGVG